MRKLLLISALLISISAYAQNYFREGLRRVVVTLPMSLDGSAPKETTTIETLENTTIIDGYEASEYWTECQETGFRNMWGYIRTDGDKVYYKVPEQSEEWYLVYDFSLQENEGCHIYDMGLVPFLSTNSHANFLMYVKCIESHKNGDNEIMVVTAYNDMLQTEPTTTYYTGDWIRGIGYAGSLVCNANYSKEGISFGTLMEASYKGKVIYKAPEAAVSVNEDIAPEVRATSGGIQITGLAGGERIQIYAFDSSAVKTVTSSAPEMNLSMPHPGMYIATVGGKSHKIVIR